MTKRVGSATLHTMPSLVFGWRTAMLTVAVVQLLVLALALTRPLANRIANRTLAALLLVLAGVVTPWLIGFAGFYDRWRWLTFAPFQITLAVAPLLWLYVRALTTGAWPARGRRHLAPAAAQFAFLFAGFLLPLPLKERWADVAYDPVTRVTDLLTVVGLAGYGIAGLRLLRTYRARLADQRSDDARFAGRWLARALAAAALLLPVWATYVVWDAIDPLGYRGLMGLYVAIAAFALYLGIEGWRHAALPFPHPGAIAPNPAPARDWRAQGKAWAAAVAANDWASDPELTLPGLARRLGTNTSYLSRALNDGLGQSFSLFVNGLRSRSVAAAIDAGDPRPLLDLALDAGFASKASFNRAFQATFGQSPSAYRRASLREKRARSAI